MKIALGIWLGTLTLAHAAELDFPQTLKEIHAKADAKTVSADFEFTNHSGKPVNVKKKDGGCSCVTVGIQDGKLHYEPGESGVIRAQFDIGNFAGSVDKIVAIWLDDDPPEKPSLSLTLRVFIPVLVELEPKTVKWDVGGKTEPQSIHITMKHDKPIHVVSVECSNEAFKHELKTIEEGKSYDLIVTPADVTQPSLSIFRISTDCEIERHKVQQAFAVIRKPMASAVATKP